MRECRLSNCKSSVIPGPPLARVLYRDDKSRGFQSNRLEYNGCMMTKKKLDRHESTAIDSNRFWTGLTASTRTPNARFLHGNPLELLIATILSAQCTDASVNIVTKDLFRKYRSPGDYVQVTQEELESDIRSTGFYRNKAKSIRGACAMILERFRGQCPGFHGGAAAASRRSAQNRERRAGRRLQ